MPNIKLETSYLKIHTHTHTHTHTHVLLALGDGPDFYPCSLSVLHSSLYKDKVKIALSSPPLLGSIQTTSPTAYRGSPEKAFPELQKIKFSTCLVSLKSKFTQGNKVTELMLSRRIHLTLQLHCILRPQRPSGPRIAHPL